MVKFDYLYKGLCGLAKAHRASPMAGHLGAAVTAGYFFGEDQSDLDEVVYRAIEKELERIIQGEEAFWYNADKAGITVAELFEPLPKERPQEDLIPTIAEALSKNIGQTRQSGHNVIFAATALRGLHDHPQFAAPNIVSGIRKLIGGFNNAPPGRGYYGKEKGWRVGEASLPQDDNFPQYKDVHEMVNVVIDELIDTASIRRQGFGGLWHIMNHAAGIVELSLFGYRDLAHQALAAHRHHVRLWRSLPDVEAELGPVKMASHDPRKPEFWTTGTLKRDQARLTHTSRPCTDSLSCCRSCRMKQNESRPRIACSISWHRDNRAGVDRRGHRDKAISDFTEAIRFNPGNADAYNERAVAYRMKGQESRAEEDSARAKRLGLELE